MRIVAVRFDTTTMRKMCYPHCDDGRGIPNGDILVSKKISVNNKVWPTHFAGYLEKFIPD